MAQIPPDLRLQAFAAAAAHVETADNNSDIEDALKVHQDESDEQLKEDMKYGLLTWGKLKPSVQYQGFQDETLAEDKPLIMQPYYFELRRKGYAPRLLSEVLYEKREQAEAAYTMQAQQAMMMGMPAPPTLEQQRAQAEEAYAMQAEEAMALGMEPPPPPELLPEKVPGLWPLLLKCRSWVVEQVAAEYRRLDKEQQKRIEAESPAEDVGELMPEMGGY